MTPTTKKRPEAPDPYEEPLAGAGLSAIIVPLIIGGALVAAAIVLWNVHVTKERVARATRTEEMIRGDLRGAYRELRSFRPETALAHIAEARMKMMKRDRHTDYAALRVAMLLAESMAEFMIDPVGKAAEVEAQFDEAVSLMTFSSGEMWEFGIFGRARARLELGKCRDAEADLTMLMERNSSFGSAYYWRSKARECLGDAKGAAADEERARALDSWPPLRDFMQAGGTWTRDILCEPEARGVK